jgi:hypothetical protein
MGLALAEVGQRRWMRLASFGFESRRPRPPAAFHLSKRPAPLARAGNAQGPGRLEPSIGPAAVPACRPPAFPRRSQPFHPPNIVATLSS